MCDGPARKSGRGERILFYQDRTEESDPGAEGIYVMSSRDGSDVTKLLDRHATVDWQVVWR